MIVNNMALWESFQQKWGKVVKCGKKSFKFTAISKKSA